MTAMCFCEMANLFTGAYLYMYQSKTAFVKIRHIWKTNTVDEKHSKQFLTCTVTELFLDVNFRINSFVSSDQLSDYQIADNIDIKCLLAITTNEILTSYWMGVFQNYFH